MFRSLVYSLITKGAVACINFFILIISSRYLGVTSRGEISIFILNITVIQIINEIYTGYSIVYFIPKYDFKKIIGAGIVYTLIFCSLSNAMIVFLNKQVKGYEWLGYIVSLLVILNTFNCVLILGKERIKLYNILSFIQPFLLMFGIVISVFVFKDYTFKAYVYPLFFSFAIAFFISVYGVFSFSNKLHSVKEFALRPIVVKGLIFQLSSLMFIFVNRYSYYLFDNPAQVGLYSSASALMESVLIIVNGISPILLSRVANEGDTFKSVQLTLSLSKASFLFSALVIMIVILLPEKFFVFVFGAGFSGIRDLMLLYAPGVLMVSFFASISYYFSAIGQQKRVLLCYSLGFIFSLSCARILISKFGCAGAAYNADLAYFLMAVSICVSFGTFNKLSFKRFFSFSRDYENLIRFISSGHR